MSLRTLVPHVAVEPGAIFPATTFSFSFTVNVNFCVELNSLLPSLTDTAHFAVTASEEVSIEVKYLAYE